MSILFIDTGWKDLGFALFGDYGKPVDVDYLKLGENPHGERVRCILDEFEYLWGNNTLNLVVYEEYNVRPGDAKSIKGQKTLLCNGIVEGFFRGNGVAVSHIDHNHWKAIYSRYKLDHTLKGLTVLTPPESANDHACDAFKMGVAWFVEKGIIK